MQQEGKLDNFHSGMPPSICGITWRNCFMWLALVLNLFDMVVLLLALCNCSGLVAPGLSFVQLLGSFSLGLVLCSGCVPCS